MKVKPIYEVRYSKKWGEWQVRNDHKGMVRAGQPYSPVVLYGFDTKEEAERCAWQLSKWHSRSAIPSERADANIKYDDCW